ncbi:MAG: sigma-70 family RNA polymerase sigma factor [Chloroflexi bacterium]|nr:sigma-70 family RNA polymerase sigma factor [Chloroflexota bacterium]
MPAAFIRDGLQVQETRDEELVLRLVEQDDMALAALYDRHSRVVYALSLRLLSEPEAAEEVVQEVFLRLWRQPTSYDPQRGLLLPWLLSVTHHRCIDELRRRRRSAPIESIANVAPLADERTDPADQAWLTERREVVRSALLTLPAEQRRALELAYFGGLTQREVAEHTGEPLGTIKTRIRLGMIKLREVLVRRGVEA